jgi:lipoate-protein ligase A
MRLTVICDSAHDAAENMAQDVALWQRVEVSPETAFLRFYDWTEECVTYGFSQKADVLKAQFPELSNISNWVKRPTGGGLVHHVPGSITFSLVIPLEFLPSTQLVASYRWLSEKTVQALKVVGVEATLRKESLPEYQDKRHHDVCKTFPAKYEIVDRNGEKLVGSAQRKGRVSLLQQTQIFSAVPSTYKEALAESLIRT